MKILVRIYDRKFIPGVGRGPFIDPPVSITEDLFRNLRIMGINAKRVKDEPKKVEATVETAVEEVEEEPIVETEVDEEIETAVEEVEEEPIVETEVDEEVESIGFDSMSNKELKQYLTEKGIEFKYNANKAELIRLAKAN